MFNPWRKNTEKPDKSQPDISYTKPDDSRIVEEDKVRSKGVFSVSHKWMQGTQSIARTLPWREMSGLLSKSVIVSPNEIAAIVQNGQVIEVVESGKVRVGGLLKTDSYFKDVEVVMMDTSPKDVNWQVGDLWTNDQHEIAAKGLLRYRIADPKKFFTMVYAYSRPDERGERFLSLEDINERIKSEVLTRVLQPEVSSVEIEEIYGNRELQLKIENELELQLKQTLDMRGLELLKFTSKWDLGDYTELARAIEMASEGMACTEEDKLSLMKEVEDRERSDTYRRQELDAKLMDTTKPIGTKQIQKQIYIGRKCFKIGREVEANDCLDCKAKINNFKIFKSSNAPKKDLTKVCDFCNENFPLDYNFCPKCGTDIQRTKEPISCFCKILYYHPMCLQREFKLSIYISQLKEEIDNIKDSKELTATPPTPIDFEPKQEKFLVLKLISAVCDVSPDERKIMFDGNINSVDFKIVPRVTGQFEIDIEIYYENEKIKEIIIPIKIQEKPIEMPLDGLCTINVTEKQIVFFSIVGTIITILSANLTINGLLLLALILSILYILWKRRPSEKTQNDGFFFKKYTND